MKTFIVLCLAIILTPCLSEGSIGSVRLRAQKVTTKISQVGQLPPGEMKEKAVRELIEDIFDFDLFAQATMKNQWDHLDENQRQRFINGFSRTFKDKVVHRFAGKTSKLDKIVFGQEYAEKDHVELPFSIRRNGKLVKLTSKWVAKSDQWKLYDLSVSKANLVVNYQGQFNKIMRDYGFEELMKRIETGQIK